MDSENEKCIREIVIVSMLSSEPTHCELCCANGMYISRKDKINFITLVKINESHDHFRNYHHGNMYEKTVFLFYFIYISIMMAKSSRKNKYRQHLHYFFSEN